MSAIRLARGFTGRDVVVKFAGCYHGHVDSLLASAGSGLATLAVPGTPGVPASAAGETHRAALQRPRRRHRGVRRARRPDRLPDHRGGAAATWASSRPSPASTASSRRPVATHGALFISDEVMTGFRATREGGWGLDGARRGLDARPDDLRQGDGRRLPGRGLRRPRRRDEPARARGPGLPGRHPLGEPDRHHRRPRHAAPRHRRGVRRPVGHRRHDQVRRGRRAHRGRCAPRRTKCRDDVLGVLPRRRGHATSPAPPHQDTKAFAAFFHAMLDAGVYLPPSAFESWFVSAAHDERAVDTILEALPTRARSAAAKERA